MQPMKHQETYTLDEARAATQASPDPLAALIEQVCDNADGKVPAGHEVGQWRVHLQVAGDPAGAAWLPVRRPNGPIPAGAKRIRVTVHGIAESTEVAA